MNYYGKEEEGEICIKGDHVSREVFECLTKVIFFMESTLELVILGCLIIERVHCNL